ncbi:MAG: hypothetical protein PHR43_00740 [Dehalococcoidales bacterium]|nr:hypothetical protein [Dehalococcoidales bacterium]
MKIETATINFPCPKCNQEFPVSLFQLHEGGIITCPWCLASNVENELSGLEHNLESLGRSLQNLKRCMEKKQRTNQ